MTETIGAIPFIIMSEGDGGYSSTVEQSPKFTWIKSQAAWQKLGYVDYFKMTQSAFPNPKSVTELDFKKHEVLLFTYGEAVGVGDTGPSIHLKKITANGKTIFTVHRKDADPNMAQAQVMTNPMQMVRIDKGLDSKNIEFIVNGKPGTFEVHIEN